MFILWSGNGLLIIDVKGGSMLATTIRTFEGLEADAQVMIDLPLRDPNESLPRLTSTWDAPGRKACYIWLHLNR